MLANFNNSMYSYWVTEPQGGQRDIANANADSQEADAANENAEIVEVLNDVEVLLGEPIIITDWMNEWKILNFSLPKMNYCLASLPLFELLPCFFAFIWS